MKKLFFIILLSGFFLSGNYAFSLPQFWYSGMAFNGSGALLPSETGTLDIRITISQSASVIYTEDWSSQNSDAFATFSVKVGTGSAVGTPLATIVIDANTTIKAEVRKSPGSYTVVGGSFLTALFESSSALNTQNDVWLDASNNNLISKNASTTPIGGSYNFIAGSDAGTDNTGSDINAFSQYSAQFNTGSHVNALGYGAAWSSSGTDINSLGQYSTSYNTGSNINALGNDASWQNTGTNVNSLGYYTTTYNTGSDVNASGYYACYQNSGSDINGFGSLAAQYNSANHVNAIGNQSAKSNTGDHVNAMGLNSAMNNAGELVNAIGESSCQSNFGGSVNALGWNSAELNTGNYVNAIGQFAAQGNTGEGVNAIGYTSADNNSGDNVNAIGYEAGRFNTHNNVNIIGKYSADAPQDETTILTGDLFLKDISGGTTTGNKIVFNNGTTISSPTVSVAEITDVLRLTPRAAAPGSPTAGMIYFNSTDNMAYIYDGTTWQSVW